MSAAVLFGSFFVLLLLTVPIGYAIGISSLIAIYYFSDIPLIIIAQKSITGVDSFPLLAIPFFMLAGNLMSSGGIARRLVNFFDALIGHVTGGLGMVTIIVCMFFAAISGSAVATVSAVGAFMIPEMVDHGYNKPFSAALTAAAGTIGVIIPPSIPFVIYGVVSGTSITDMFTAGFMPGIMMGAALMIVCYFVSKKNGYRGKEKASSAKEIWVAFKDAFWAILSPVIILGGIYSGFFTPTEAAVISVVYSFIVGVFVYKELDVRGAYKSFKDAIVAILGLTDNAILILLIINIFLLIVGMFIDNIPATIILTPILLPICTGVGMHPVTFGIMLTMNLAIGFCSPPYGINLFVASSISKVSIEDLTKKIIKPLLALIAVLLLITYVPICTTIFLK